MNGNRSLSKLPRRSVLCASIALALALGPVAVLAQDEEEEAPSKEFLELTQNKSEIEVGMCYVSDDSRRFGRYNGLDDEGSDLLLNFDIVRTAPYDSDSAAFFRFEGRNLGLDTREARVEFGKQGKYEVHFDYDQVPSLRSGDVATIYNGAGTDTLTLPPNWVGGQNTATMTQLLPSLKGFELGTERRRAGAGVDGQLTQHWSIVTDFRRETKEGIKTLGGVFGNSGGNPRAVLLPEPVDYTTDQVDAILRYTEKKWQVQLAYYASIFSDGTNGLAFQNPYALINGWAPPQAGFPNGRGEISTPPDNQFHQVTVEGGYNFSEHTRLSGSYARGQMSQSEQYLAYSALPQIQATITQPLPRNSLDGEINTTVATLKLSSQAWDSFFWNASYRYDDRDNDTPVDRYVYIGGDTQVQPGPSAVTDRARFNEPYSFKDEQYKLEGGYRIFQNTELTLGGQHRDFERTYSEVENTNENSWRAELRTGWSDWITANVRWTHANRDGSHYEYAAPLESYDPAYAATIAGGFESAPALRKFNQANVTRDQGAAHVSITPIASLTVSGGVDYALDEYDESELGLQLARIRSTTIDAVYAPLNDLSLYGYYTWERMDYDQAGRSIQGGADKVPSSTNVNRNWFAFHRDSLEVGGLGAKYTLDWHHAEIGGDYVHSRSDSDIDFRVGSALTTAPLPNAKTKLDSISVYGSCQLRENLSLNLRYWYEKYDQGDWQLDGIVPNQLANVITLGEHTEDYKVHVVFASLVWRF